VSASEIQVILVATVTGLISSTTFLVSLFVGFCFLAGLPKLRKSGRGSMVVRNIAEQMTGEARYIRPDAPSGSADQLRSPELLEQTGRKQ
jgi:hypothetical protein